MSDTLALPRLYVEKYWHRSGRKISRLTGLTVVAPLPGSVELTHATGCDFDPVAPLWDRLWFLTDADQRLVRESTTFEDFPEQACEDAYGLELDPLAAVVATAALRQKLETVHDFILTHSRRADGQYGDLRQGGEWEAALTEFLEQSFTVEIPPGPEWRR